MTPNDLLWRVSRDVCALGVVMAALAAWLGGGTAALGVAAGVVLALGNFRWLVARACATTGTPAAASALWSMGTGLRFVAFGSLCAVLLASGWAHPLGLVAGLTALPCAIVGHGLRSAAEES
jgi:glucose uptake protein GlcU